MATADRDGRIAQALQDRLTCLGMEICEGIREGVERALAELPPAPGDES